MKSVSAILLAAGQAKRMGAFKPLLPFGNQSVIQSVIAQFRSAGIENVVVVVGHRAEEMKKHLESTGVRVAINEDPASEMGASIACGVEFLPSEAQAVLIALGDQPVVAPEVIQTLIKEWQSGSKLVIPEYEGRGGHPVLIDLDFKAQLFALEPNSGLKGFFTDHRDQTLRVPVSSAFIVQDMDTWAEYEELHQKIFGVSPPVNRGQTEDE